MTGFSGHQHAIILLASAHLPDGQWEDTLHGICQPAGYLPAWFWPCLSMHFMSDKRLKEWAGTNKTSK